MISAAPLCVGPLQSCHPFPRAASPPCRAAPAAGLEEAWHRRTEWPLYWEEEGLPWPYWGEEGLPWHRVRGSRRRSSMLD